MVALWEFIAFLSGGFLSGSAFFALYRFVYQRLPLFVVFYRLCCQFCCQIDEEIWDLVWLCKRVYVVTLSNYTTRELSLNGLLLAEVYPQ